MQFAYEKYYEKCLLIRCFEQTIEREFGNGTMRGTTHGCVGQEIIPVLLMEHLDRENDYIVGTHRCHGQVLAYDTNPYALFCEMMGRKDGFVEGMGGSQHIKTGHYLTNGITGGMAVVGNGIAMSIKKNNKSGIVISFVGDGGFNEGYVQETLNMASTYETPILFVCENNGYAMSTHTESYSAGSFQARVEAHGMKYIRSSTQDVEILSDDISTAVKFVREKKEPCFLDIITARLCGHSKSDKMEYMSEKERNSNIENDPLLQLKQKMTDSMIREIDEAVVTQIEHDYSKAVNCMEKGIIK